MYSTLAVHSHACDVCVTIELTYSTPCWGLLGVMGCSYPDLPVTLLHTAGCYAGYTAGTRGVLGGLE